MAFTVEVSLNAPFLSSSQLRIVLVEMLRHPTNFFCLYAETARLQYSNPL